MSNDAVLAEIFRRVLAEHYSLLGPELSVNSSVTLTDEEWDLVWDELNAISGEDFSLRLPVLDQEHDA